MLSFTTLGVRGERAMTLGVMDATLTGMAGWRHAFGHTSPGKTYAFSAGDAFPPVPFSSGSWYARRMCRDVKRSRTWRAAWATARIGVAFPNRTPRGIDHGQSDGARVPPGWLR
ncbi:hypothetical protein CN074_31905 [Sinorhizobium medicae]|nr:hypothetical protein CN201_27100 [Sinorhizobium medicae]RVP59599.1 hypothetical protein CN074_31905 [Sinorhizobium medicae]